MGTSLSGLTPATTFDGLLKVGDNDPLTADLKAISTGEGTDTMLELSTTALQIGGATGMYWDNTNKRLGIATDAPSVPFEVYGGVRFRSGLNLNGILSNSSTGKVDINNIGFFDAINDRVGIGESTPASRLHIKGSGATSATTSLLVQNSAGTDVFKVVDDNTMFYHTHKFRSAGGYLYIEIEANADRSLKIGPTFTSTSYGGHIFKTYDGTAYTEVMSITGNTDQFVGIGETTPTARLHIKGSGNSSADYALKVLNSDDTTLFDIRNDSVVRIAPNSTNAVSFRNAKMQDGNAVFGTTTIPANTRFTIKGSGATSATTALLVQNSAGTEAFKVEDGGDIVTKGFTFASNTIRPNINGYIGLDRNSNRTFSIVDTNATRTYLNIQSSSTSNFADVSVNTDHLVVKKEGNVAVGTSTLDASAKLQVDSTTQGFLPPRMTQGERDAITTPAAGLMVYNTDTNTAECWNGSAWMPMF